MRLPDLNKRCDHGKFVSHMYDERYDDLGYLQSWLVCPGPDVWSEHPNVPGSPEKA